MDTTHYRVLIYHVQTLDSIHFAANNNRKEDEERGVVGAIRSGVLSYKMVSRTLE